MNLYGSRPPTHRQSGFTLLELTVVLVISGMILGAGIPLVKPYVEMVRMESTKRKMETIADALARFAQIHGSLPCAADPTHTDGEPFGAPMGSLANGTNVTGACRVSGTFIMVGIVPFRALGLSEDDARDAYGNYIDYALNLQLARFSPRIHQSCRTRAWIDPVSNMNRNPRKAALCCPSLESSGYNLLLSDETGNIFPTIPPSATHYATVNQLYDGITPAPDNNTATVAFILVSHGVNGDGARVRDSMWINHPPTTVDDSPERENYWGDVRYNIFPYSTAEDNNYFDDIVVWRTNEQLVSAFGHDSCGKP